MLSSSMQVILFLAWFALVAASPTVPPTTKDCVIFGHSIPDCSIVNLIGSIGSGVKVPLVGGVNGNRTHTFNATREIKTFENKTNTKTTASGSVSNHTATFDVGGPFIGNETVLVETITVLLTQSLPNLKVAVKALVDASNIGVDKPQSRVVEIQGFVTSIDKLLSRLELNGTHSVPSMTQRLSIEIDLANVLEQLEDMRVGASQYRDLLSVRVGVQHLLDMLDS